MIRNTRQIKIGDLTLGASAPLRIQTMIKSSMDDHDAVREEAAGLIGAGAEMLRCALPDKNSPEKMYSLLKGFNVPLIADCHFQSAIAQSAIEIGFDKIRLNPGNMSKNALKDAVNTAKKHDIALRFGFNSGSFSSANGIEMAQAAVELDEWIRSLDFLNYVVSLKSSSVFDTIQANRFFSMKTDTPLHIGITATGPYYEGLIKSSAGLGSLLMDGIGDTIRVSLTADSIEEIKAARVLRHISSGGTESLEIISCPTCSRRRIDVRKLVDAFESLLKKEDFNILKKIAIMGCEVNGPGEAKEADFGVCGSKNGGVFIARGKIIKHVEEDEMIRLLISELRK